MTIGEAIKKYRTEQGLTQKQLGARIGRSSRSIKHYEKNEIIPSVSILEQLFNIKIQELIFNEVMRCHNE